MRLLIIGDPFANPLITAVDEFEKTLGRQVIIEPVGYNDTRELALQNRRDTESSYHIISFDVVWMGEYADKKVLLGLDSYLKGAPEMELDDLLVVPYRSSGYDGVQYGIPIQPHAELLWYRTDLLAKHNLKPPQTTEDLLAILKILHNPEQGIYGIFWNAQRGQALGQTMAHFYAAFGSSLLDEEGRPDLDTEAGREAARFALALMKYSPPDILSVAWDERTRRFAEGQAAMTYGWGARAYVAESTPLSVVAGKVGYAGAPVAPGVKPVTPVGTWSLGIPANLAPDQREDAWKLLKMITSPAGAKRIAQLGSGGMPRYSVISDPALQKTFPAFSTTLALSKKGELADFMRPAIPQWAGLSEIMGTVFHEMLEGDLTPEAACRETQRQAMTLFQIPPRGRHE